MARRKSFKYKFKIFISMVIVLYGIVCVASFVQSSLYLASKDDEIAKLKADITALTEEHEDKEKILESGDEKQIIESAARDRLDYIYDSEIVIVSKD